MSPQSDTVLATPQGAALASTTLLSIRQIFVGLITIAGIILLPLLLGPSDFSLYGYVNMILLLGAAVGDLGFGAYVIRHDVSDRKLRGMLGLQLLFWMGIAVVLMSIFLAGDPFGFSTFTYALLCVCLVFFALQSLPTALLEKRLDFLRISTVEISQRVIFVSFAICLAAFVPTEWVIPIAALVAAVVIYPVFMRLAQWPGLPLLLRGEPLFRGFSSEWWQTRIANQLAYGAFPILGGLLFTTGEVGLLIWAVSISMIPGYFAPMAARAIFPLLTKSGTHERVLIHQSVLRALLLLSTPLITLMVIVAYPLTEVLFGSQWTDGVQSLQVLLLTGGFAVAVAVTIPLAFLEGSAHHVKWSSVCATLLVYLLGFGLADRVALLSIPIAGLISGLLLLIALDFILRKSVSYSPLTICLPASYGLVIGLAVGLGLSFLLGGGLLISAISAFLAIAIQIPMIWLLGGGISLGALRSQVALIRRKPYIET